MPERQPHILVADDDGDMRLWLLDALMRRGYACVPAANGEEALAVAQRCPLALALIDVELPGPAGMERAAQLQALRPDMAVIILTAHASVAGAVEAPRQGAFGYLEKPVAVERLLAAVQEALAGWRNGTGARGAGEATS